MKLWTPMETRVAPASRAAASTSSVSDSGLASNESSEVAPTLRTREARASAPSIVGVPPPT